MFTCCFELTVKVLVQSVVWSPISYLFTSRLWEGINNGELCILHWFVSVLTIFSFVQCFPRGPQASPSQLHLMREKMKRVSVYALLSVSVHAMRYSVFFYPCELILDIAGFYGSFSII